MWWGGVSGGTLHLVTGVMLGGGEEVGNKQVHITQTENEFQQLTEHSN